MFPPFADNTIKNRWHLIIRGKNADAISLQSVDQLLQAHTSSSVLPTVAPHAPPVSRTQVSASSTGGGSENNNDRDVPTVVPESPSTIIVDCSTLNISPTDNSLV